MQYNLASGTTRTLYTGLTEALVPYGSTVIFTGLVPHAAPPGVDPYQNGPPEQMYALDQTTGRAMAPPVGMTAAADGANEIVTDGSLIVWNTARGGLRGWRPTWGRTVPILPDLGWAEGLKLQMSAAATPRIFGQFIVFQPSETYVLDMKTNTFARLATNPGTEDVSGSQLSLEEYTTPTSANRTTGVIQFNQYLVDLSHLPDFSACPTGT